MSADHLTPEALGALADGELQGAAQAEANAHLRACHACSLEVVSALQLKGAVSHAARRFSPSPETLVRLSAAARQAPAQQTRPVPLRPILWSSIAAVLLIAVVLVGWRQSHQGAALTAELLDQHLASLADSSSPQVISTDRHTVKPWFQGKLPFSFNLPEANALPPETVLQGADFTYVEGRPAALLLFSIRKHKASVFVTEGGTLIVPGLHTARSGFHVSEVRTSGLDLTGVSDVNPPDLDALLRALASVQ